MIRRLENAVVHVGRQKTVEAVVGLLLYFHQAVPLVCSVNPLSQGAESWHRVCGVAPDSTCGLR